MPIFAEVTENEFVIERLLHDIDTFAIAVLFTRCGQQIVALPVEYSCAMLPSAYRQHYTTSGHNFLVLTSAPVNICIMF